MARPPMQSGLAGAAILVALFAPDETSAQQKGDARIAGIVINASDRQPIVGARVRLVGTAHLLVTDSTGTFLFKDLPAGVYVLEAVIIGRDSSAAEINLGRKDRLDVEFAVGAVLGQALPELEVAADPEQTSGRPDFERRRQEGQGRYITREYIEQRNPANLMDLLRGVPGVRIECGRGRDCAMRFSRHQRGCGPAYWMDGIPSDPAILFLTLPHDVAGIEVYTGPSETPPEMEGAGSRCGVIAIWTRVGRRNR